MMTLNHNVTVTCINVSVCFYAETVLSVAKQLRGRDLFDWHLNQPVLRKIAL